MATRSIIAIENDDSTVESIFCHWNGAPENNGRTLYEHFSNKDKLKELIALGDVSILHPRLRPTGKHSFDKPRKNTTIAYHRDRGDAWKDTQPHKFSTLKEFLMQTFGYFDAEYLYVLTKKGRWTIYKTRARRDKPVSRARSWEAILKQERIDAQ